MSRFTRVPHTVPKRKIPHRPSMKELEILKSRLVKETSDLQKAQLKQAFDRIAKLEAEIGHLNALFQARLNDDIDLRANLVYIENKLNNVIRSQDV